MVFFDLCGSCVCTYTGVPYTDKCVCVRKVQGRVSRHGTEMLLSIMASYALPSTLPPEKVASWVISGGNLTVYTALNNTDE